MLLEMTVALKRIREDQEVLAIFKRNELRALHFTRYLHM